MKKKISPLLIAGLMLFYCAGSLAAAEKLIFEFLNDAKVAVEIGLGTPKNPPQKHTVQEVKAGGKITDPLEDDMEFILKMKNGDSFDYFTYKFKQTAGKNIRLKLTSATYDKKTGLPPLVSRFMPKTIDTKDIIIIEKQIKDGPVEKMNVQEEKKPEAKKEDPDADEPAAKDEKKTDEDAKGDDEDKKKDDSDEAKEEPKKPSVTPYQALGLTEKASAAKILGLRFDSTLKEAAETGHISLEWDGIKKAQTEIGSAYGARKAIWAKDKVTKQAKATLDRLKVPEDEQQELVNEVSELLDTTYQNVKKTFSKLPGAPDDEGEDASIDWE